MLLEGRGDAKLHLLSPQTHMILPRWGKGGRPREAGAPGTAADTSRSMRRRWLRMSSGLRSMCHRRFRGADGW
jgi:hypothetical protein